VIIELKKTAFTAIPLMFSTSALGDLGAKGWKDLPWTSQNGRGKKVDYQKRVAPLIEAVRKQQDEIKALKADFAQCALKIKPW